MATSTTGKTRCVETEAKSRRQKDIVFSACLGTDPHHVVWFKNIPSDELLSDIEFEYEGSDDIRFYTHRYFEIYRHEQLT